MSVRRGTARGVTAGVLLAGLVFSGVILGLATATPALAAEDSVRLRAASSFRAGGSPGSASIAVAKRTDGCVSLRTALGIRLPGLTADQVKVESAVSGGGWRPVAVSSGGADLVVTERTRPERPSLCKGKSVTVRYRLTFGKAAPNGTVLLVAEAYTVDGAVVGRDSDNARVRGGRPAAAPTLPAVVPTSAAATPEATEEAAEVAEETEVVAAAPARAADLEPRAADSGGGGFFGLGTVLLLVGVGMVGIGVALLVLLIRRNRAERSGTRLVGAAAGQPATYLATPAGPGAAEPTAYLPPTSRVARHGHPFQPGPSAVDPPGVNSSAGPQVDSTLILPTSVPPRAPSVPPRATSVPPRAPVQPENPDATLILPTDRSPRSRPGDRPER